jgi:hypothetical protein
MVILAHRRRADALLFLLLSSLCSSPALLLIYRWASLLPLYPILVSRIHLIGRHGVCIEVSRNVSISNQSVPLPHQLSLSVPQPHLISSPPKAIQHLPEEKNLDASIVPPSLHIHQPTARLI